MIFTKLTEVVVVNSVCVNINKVDFLRNSCYLDYSTPEVFPVAPITVIAIGALVMDTGLLIYHKKTQTPERSFCLFCYCPDFVDVVHGVVWSAFPALDFRRLANRHIALRFLLKNNS